MKTRTAQCQCGQLIVQAKGEPDHVFMCHCEDCQRRTGSSYHLGAWFPGPDVSINGESKRYAREADSSAPVELFFCIKCGSTVYFTVPELLPEMIGVAVGCFTDPDFRPPDASVFGKRRHRWLKVPESVPSYVEWTDGDLE